MKTGYFLLLTFLLGNILAFQGISRDKNQTNQKDVVSKNISLKLRLNNEEMGTTDDTSVLSRRLEEVFNNRAKEGVFNQETNEIIKAVHLEGDRSVSADEIAKLFGVLNDLGVAPILIPVKVKNAFPRPNPLTLLVYAGSGESRFASAGIEIEFIGELSEKGAIAVEVNKNGAYTMGGKQISASALTINIKNRLKTKQKNKKTIFVQAENYGNMEDIASIAASAGAVKVYFMIKNN